MKGKLILIPTPIDEQSPLELTARERMMKACQESNSIFAVEELKSGRRRWIHFGLPRDFLNTLVLFNEHTSKEVTSLLLRELGLGKDVFLMSDGGLPAFMDPGRELVRRCHENGIKVTSTPFCNSVILALALSGICHERFLFEGRLPAKAFEREKKIVEIINCKETVVLLDTPYRLKTTLESLINHKLKRNVFLAMDLNCHTEELLFGLVSQIIEKIKDFKREFILIVE